MDGFFVPEKSWPYSQNFGSPTSEVLPYRDNLDYEIDLMVSKPLKPAGEWTSAGAQRIIVHVESDCDFEKLLANLKEKVELGIALNIQTSNDILHPLVEQFDFIQCMGIEKIGYQGEPFSERVIPKIEDLRKRYPDAIISVDGGVNFENAPRLVKAGASRLVSGSTIWNALNIKEAIERLANSR